MPTVLYTMEYFMHDTHSAMIMGGCPDLREVVNLNLSLGESQGAQRQLEAIVAALTDPLTEEEQKTGIIIPPPQDRIIMTGTIEEINQTFMDLQLSDGLPIYPATEERVAEFMACTSHPPEEIVNDHYWPQEYAVSVEKVAIVGAMAGCKPEYMPVLLAVVQAMESIDFSSAPRSTQSFIYCTLVNGPIRNEIEMNSQDNALGPCNRANATIGRFHTLSMICLGGRWPGVNEMAVQGKPSKYGFCFAEDEENSPWEPFHVSQGYGAEESTITLSNGGWGQGGNSTSIATIGTALKTLQLRKGALIVVSQTAAKSWARTYVTKQAVEYAIWDATKETFGEFQRNWYNIVVTNSWAMGDFTLWPDYRGLPNDAIVHAYPLKFVRVVVAGSAGMGVAQYWNLYYYHIRSVDFWR